MRQFSASAPSLSEEALRPRRLGIGLGLAACVLVAAMLCLPGLGKRPLYSAGEVRSALIAQAMLESGDWVHPRLNRVRYYEKPPLFYWSIGGAFAWLGVHEFASRLPAALAYMATAVLVFLLGLDLLGPAGATASRMRSPCRA